MAFIVAHVNAGVIPVVAVVGIVDPLPPHPGIWVPANTSPNTAWRKTSTVFVAVPKGRTKEWDSGGRKGRAGRRSRG